MNQPWGPFAKLCPSLGEDRRCPHIHCFQVYGVDFTCVGYHCNRSDLTTLSKMSESLAFEPIELCSDNIGTKIQVPLEISTLKRGSANP